MLLLVYELVVVLLLFLYVLNLYLRGSKKVITEFVLSIAILVAAASGFVVFGWKIGLPTVLVGYFVALPAMRSVAQPLAERMLGYRTSIYGDGEEYGFEGMEAFEKRWERDQKKLQRLSARPGVASVMREFGKSGADDLEEHYLFLLREVGMLAWDIIESPQDLRESLQLRASGLAGMAFAIKMKHWRT